ncbi:putative mannose-1-phosphate guanylyltransferase [Cyclospora cayetanensis]|uniref:Mannose-1-phosphate guanylyltransferase n=1 Tax=Cyclospora cayetanensis TaxID=88456 RepID=A0A1D3D602_9EIME|nr:putative mannose-1-phosphate guanylyltransferase [Cyclospora cayetanensis]
MRVFGQRRLPVSESGRSENSSCGGSRKVWNTVVRESLERFLFEGCAVEAALLGSCNCPVNSSNCCDCDGCMRAAAAGGQYAPSSAAVLRQLLTLPELFAAAGEGLEGGAPGNQEAIRGGSPMEQGEASSPSREQQHQHMTLENHVKLTFCLLRFLLHIAAARTESAATRGVVLGDWEAGQLMEGIHLRLLSAEETLRCCGMAAAEGFAAAALGRGPQGGGALGDRGPARLACEEDDDEDEEAPSGGERALFFRALRDPGLLSRCRQLLPLLSVFIANEASEGAHWGGPWALGDPRPVLCDVLHSSDEGSPVEASLEASSSASTAKRAASAGGAPPQEVAVPVPTGPSPTIVDGGFALPAAASLLQAARYSLRGPSADAAERRDPVTQCLLGRRQAAAKLPSDPPGKEAVGAPQEAVADSHGAPSHVAVVLDPEDTEEETDEDEACLAQLPDLQPLLQGRPLAPVSGGSREGTGAPPGGPQTLWQALEWLLGNPVLSDVCPAATAAAAGDPLKRGPQGSAARAPSQRLMREAAAAQAVTRIAVLQVQRYLQWNPLGLPTGCLQGAPDEVRAVEGSVTGFITDQMEDAVALPLLQALLGLDCSLQPALLKPLVTAAASAVFAAYFPLLLRQLGQLLLHQQSSISQKLLLLQALQRAARWLRDGAPRDGRALYTDNSLPKKPPKPSQLKQANSQEEQPQQGDYGGPPGPNPLDCEQPEGPQPLAPPQKEQQRQMQARFLSEVRVRRFARPSVPLRGAINLFAPLMEASLGALEGFCAPGAPQSQGAPPAVAASERQVCFCTSGGTPIEIYAGELSAFWGVLARLFLGGFSPPGCSNTKPQQAWVSWMQGRKLEGENATLPPETSCGGFEGVTDALAITAKTDPDESCRYMASALLAEWLHHSREETAAMWEAVGAP